MSSIRKSTAAYGATAATVITLAFLANSVGGETVDQAATRERASTRLSLLTGYKCANWFEVLKEAPADQHQRLLSMADEVSPIAGGGSRYVFNVEEKPGTDERYHYTLVLTITPQGRCWTITDVEVISPEY